MKASYAEYVGQLVVKESSSSSKAMVVKESSSSSKANVNPDVGKGSDDGNSVVNPDGEGLDGVESLEKLVNEGKKKGIS